MHIEVVCLLEAPATLVAGEVQLGLRLVLGHVVLEGRPLAALEAADLTPGGRAGMSLWGSHLGLPCREELTPNPTQPLAVQSKQEEASGCEMALE